MSTRRIIYALLVAAVAVVSAFAGAAAGGAAVYRALGGPGRTVQSANPAPHPGTEPGQSMVFDSTQIQTSITQAAQKVGATVVTVVGTVPGQVTFFGQAGDQMVSGSGFFVSDQGYVLTNNHVVEGTREVSIILADGRQQTAQIVGSDPYSDIAVLKTDEDVPAVATLGNSDILQPGETVIAIGSPLGDFKNSVTVGVVSATGRSIDTGQGYQIENLVQTDAAINQGNSGGPLVNLAGEVIGINTLIVRGNGSGAVAEGLGFAIPINTAQAIAQQIIEQGYFARPYMGISFQPITPEIAARYGLPVDWGVYVTDVVEGSPASQAGLQRGDIITQIDNVELDETRSYINTLYSYQPGDTIPLVVVRDDQRLEMKITLGETRRQ